MIKPKRSQWNNIFTVHIFWKSRWIFSFPQNFRDRNTLRRPFCNITCFYILQFFWEILSSMSEGSNLHTHVYPTYSIKAPLKSIKSHTIFFSKSCINITLWNRIFLKRGDLLQFSGLGTFISITKVIKKKEREKERKKGENRVNILYKFCKDDSNQQTSFIDKSLLLPLQWASSTCMGREMTAGQLFTA